MVKALVLLASADYSLTCDMMAIKKYLDNKVVTMSRYLSVAKTNRERYLHGPPYGKTCVFDPVADFKFWREIENDAFFAEAQRELVSMTDITPLATPERLLLVILSHGNDVGLVMMGDVLYPISRI